MWIARHATDDVGSVTVDQHGKRAEKHSSRHHRHHHDRHHHRSHSHSKAKEVKPRGDAITAGTRDIIAMLEGKRPTLDDIIKRDASPDSDDVSEPGTATILEVRENRDGA